MSESFEVIPRKSSSSRWLCILLGFLLGAGIASGGWWFYHRHKQQQLVMELGGFRLDPNAMLNMLEGEKKLAPAEVGDQAFVMKAGKAFVADLESQRLASAYRTLSSAYQMQLKRADFDLMIAKYPGLRRLASFQSSREEKSRKGADGKSWEYYFTGKDQVQISPMDLVNVALTFTQDGTEWKISDVEISAESKK